MYILNHYLVGLKNWYYQWGFLFLFYIIVLLQLAWKLALRASGIGPFAASWKIGLRTTLDELARPLVELQERLIEAEDPYFELKNGGLRALKRLFELKGVLAQLTFNFSEVRYAWWSAAWKRWELCNQWFKSDDPSRKQAQNEVQNWRSCFSWLES